MSNTPRVFTSGKALPLRAAIALLALQSGSLAAQQVATSGRDLPTELVEEIIVTERSLETTLPLELARYGADLELLTAEQIRNHGFVDVSQALEMLVPGLHLTTQAGAFSYVNLQMQGSRSSDVLWAVDGVRINNRLYNSTSPADTLPSSMIERTEVLKGGHGLMYGTQAIAGVMNVVTRSFSDSPDGGVSVGTGSYGLRRVNGYGRGALGDHKFVGWVSHDESEGYEIYDRYQPSALHRKRGYEVDSVGLKYGYDFTPDLRLSLMGIHTEAALAYPSVSNVSINDRNEEIFSGRLDYTPSDETQFFVKGYYHDWDTDYYTPGSTSDYWGYTDRGLTIGALLAPHRFFEYHLGYDFQIYEGQDDVLLIAKQREKVNAVYAQLRSSDELSEDFRFALGARYNDTGGHTSTIWNVMAAYDITDELYLQGMVGSSFMLPSAENLYRIHCPTGADCTHGNPNLGPEESIGANLSLGGEFELSGRALSWQLTTWDRRIDNLIQRQPIPLDHPNPPPPAFSHTFVNVPVEVKASGWEGLLRGPLSDTLSFDLSYTDSKEVAAGSSVQLRDRPRRQYKGSLAWQSSRFPLGLNLAFKYIGKKTADVTGFGVQDYGDNYVLDVGANLRLGREEQHRFSLRLENLLDEDYATAVSSAPLEGSSERFLWRRLAPPRIVHLNYSYEF